MDLGGDFGPAAVAVDAAVGAHGAEDRVAGECYVVDGFDEGVEGGVQTFAALQEQAGGPGMAVDGAVVGKLVVLSELPGGAPVDELLFDSFAFGVVADDAAAAVPFEEQDLKLLLQPSLTEAGDRSICRRTAGAGRLSFSRLLGAFPTTPILYRWTLINETRLSGSQ